MTRFSLVLLIPFALAAPENVSAQTVTTRFSELERLQAMTKYLLLDPRIVEQAGNARLTLGPIRKEPRNPLFIEEKPWEPRFDNLYPNVLYDEEDKAYKCWYSPFIVDQAVTRTPPEKRKTLSYLAALHGNDRYMGICYAVSQDGLAWTRPDLGLVEFNGSRQNNIVLRGVHGAGIKKDLREPDPARRYKLFGKTGEDREPMGVAFSPDGLRWSKPVPCPEIGAAGDTHNNACWDPHLSRYVGFTRLWDGQRIVGRCESPDFVKWTKAVEVLRGTRQHQAYGMPVFLYEGVYLGLLTTLDTRSDMVDCELAWSPDGSRWERICEGSPLIPRGPAGSFDHGCIYPAAYPILRDGEIRLYYAGSDDTHGGWRKGGFGLAHLRPDGFAGYEPIDGQGPATVITRPVAYAGGRLQVSGDARGGAIQVQMLDTQGALLASSRPLTGELSDKAVEWDTGGPAAESKGGLVKLRFEFRAARLYSFRFVN